jgi:hypothetical protein
MRNALTDRPFSIPGGRHCERGYQHNRQNRQHAYDSINLVFHEVTCPILSGLSPTIQLGFLITQRGRGFPARALSIVRDWLRPRCIEWPARGRSA